MRLRYPVSVLHWHVCNDKKLSADALGMLCYIMNDNFNGEPIEKSKERFGWDKQKCDAVIKEIKKAGYAHEQYQGCEKILIFTDTKTLK